MTSFTTIAGLIRLTVFVTANGVHLLVGDYKLPDGYYRNAV